MKVRPAFLVAEPEPLQSLSVRKLVLETAKFNVLTAHSTEEAIAMFQLFPNVAGAVLVAGDRSIDCGKIAKVIKAMTPKVPVVALLSSNDSCDSADHRLSPLGPEDLLALLREKFGDPRKMDQETSS